MAPPPNPWTTLSTRLVYENPWLRLREDQVLRPDGQPGIYSVIDTRVACGVVALTPEREVYLVGQWRYPFDAYSWEIVEGGTDHDDEPPIVAARRELQEEAGLEAARWTELGPEVHLSNCFSSEVARLWLAEDLTEVPASPDGNEQLEIRKVPFDDALGDVAAGRIQDAMSVIALMRAQALLATRG